MIVQNDVQSQGRANPQRDLNNRRVYSSTCPESALINRKFSRCLLVSLLVALTYACDALIGPPEDAGIPERVPAGISGMGWSNDRSAIFYSTDNNNIYKCILPDRDPVLLRRGKIYTPLADGLAFIYRLVETGQWGVMDSECNALNEFQITREMARPGSITPIVEAGRIVDGLYAYVENRGSLKVKNWTGSIDREIYRDNSSALYSPVWSPDGGEIAFAAGEDITRKHYFCSVRVSDGMLTIKDEMNLNLYQISRSPYSDNQFALIYIGDRAISVGLYEPGKEPILWMDHITARFIYWRPSHRTAAALDEAYHWRMVNLSGQEIMKTDALEWMNDLEHWKYALSWDTYMPTRIADWSPDGRYFAYISGRERERITVIDLIGYNQFDVISPESLELNQENRVNDAVNKVVYRFSIDKKVYRNGERISAVFQIENHGRRPQVFGYSGMELNFDFFTSDGELVLHFPSAESGEVNEIMIERGSTQKWMVTFTPEPWYVDREPYVFSIDELPPGNYTIEAYTDRKRPKLRLDFEVTE